MANENGHASETKAKQDMISNMHNLKSRDALLSDEEIESMTDKLIDENIEALSELAK